MEFTSRNKVRSYFILGVLKGKPVLVEPVKGQSRSSLPTRYSRQQM